MAGAMNEIGGAHSEVIGLCGKNSSHLHEVVLDRILLGARPVVV